MAALQDVRSRFGVKTEGGDDDDGGKPRRGLQRTVSTSVVVDPSKMTASQALRAKKAGDSFKPRAAAKDDLIKKCHASGTPLTGVKPIEWNGNQYHPDHFLCVTCKTKLGRNIVNVSNEPYCEKCGRKAFVTSKIKTRTNTATPEKRPTGTGIADAYEAEEREKMRKAAEEAKKDTDTDEKPPETPGSATQKSSIPAWKLKLMERSQAGAGATAAKTTPAATTATPAAKPAEPAADTYSCGSCKETNPSGVKFCQSCGAPKTAAATPAPAATDLSWKDKLAERKAAENTGAAEKAAADKAAADKAAADKAAADKAAADKAAAEKAAADKAAAEKAASLKAASDKAAADKAAADRAAADKVAADKAAAERAAADKAAAEKIAVQKLAAEKAAAEKAAAEKKAAEAARAASEASEKARLEEAAKQGLQSEVNALKAELEKIKLQLQSEQQFVQRQKEENIKLKSEVAQLKEENQTLRSNPQSAPQKYTIVEEPVVVTLPTPTQKPAPPILESSTVEEVTLPKPVQATKPAVVESTTTTLPTPTPGVGKTVAVLPGRTNIPAWQQKLLDKKAAEANKGK